MNNPITRNKSNYSLLKKAAWISSRGILRSILTRGVIIILPTSASSPEIMAASPTQSMQIISLKVLMGRITLSLAQLASGRSSTEPILPCLVMNFRKDPIEHRGAIILAGSNYLKYKIRRSRWIGWLLLIASSSITSKCWWSLIKSSGSRGSWAIAG